MIYTSQVAGQGGNITVRIYDGVGGRDCLQAKEHYWNYNITNPTSDLTSSTGSGTTTNVSLLSRTIIMDYMLARNNTCTKVEAVLQVPNFRTDQTKNNNSKTAKNEFMILGFVWKEWIFGIMFITVFLFCFCGGCAVVVRPLGDLVEMMKGWMQRSRRSHVQFNYNDYID
jgi:hypothetical protein